MNYDMWILGLIAGLMGIFTSYILYLSRTAENPLRKIITYILLAMMNGMLLGPAIYLSGVITISLEDAVVISAGLMAIEIIYPLILFVRSIEQEDIEIRISIPVIIFLTLLNEFLMSLDFNSIILSKTILCSLACVKSIDNC